VEDSRNKFTDFTEENSHVSVLIKLEKMNGPQIHHITDTVVRECFKGDAESLWGREI